MIVSDELIVFFDQNFALVDGIEKGRPTAARIELQIRGEQILATNHTTVGARLVELVEFTGVRFFRELLLRNFVLKWRQDGLEVGWSSL